MLKSATYFIKFSFKHRPNYLIFSVAHQICYALDIIIKIYFSKIIIDELYTKQRADHALYLVLLITMGSVMVQAGKNLFLYYSENEKDQLQKDFEAYLCSNLASCNYENIETPQFWDLKEKANNYIGGQWGQFGKQLDVIFDLLGNVVTLVCTFYLLLQIDFGIILCYIVLFIISNMVSTYYKKKSMQLQMNEMPTVMRRKNYYEDLTKNISYAKEIRVNSLSTWILEKYRSYMLKFAATTLNIYRYNLRLKLFIGITEGIKLVVTYLYLFYSVVHGNITVGEFTMLLGAITLFNSAISNILTESMEISRYKAYYDAFCAYVNPPERVCGTLSVKPEKKYRIELCNVSFKYSGQKDYAIKNVSMTIEGNQKVAIIGKNGAGKSTIIKLIMGFYHDYEGEIKLNGINVKEYDTEEYRRMISTVFQDFMLYAFSLKENVCFQNSGLINDEKVTQVLKEMGLACKLRAIKENLSVPMFKFFDEHGIEVSGGEGQKIGIARAAVRQTPILILDEPTAALDPRAEAEIYESFSQIVNNKTAIYISHRLALSRTCDKIIVVDDGKIAEEGSHSELMKRGGLYAQMYQMQAGMYQ